jgi:hypothetical protein
MDNLNSQSYRSLKAKSYNKESLTMTSIALWTAFLKTDQQLLLTEQLMLQTILLIQIN